MDCFEHKGSSSLADTGHDEPYLLTVARFYRYFARERVKLSRIIGVSTIFFAVLVLAAGGAWAPAATTKAAAGSTTFQDSTAERPDSPDITTVVVANTNAGAITFRVNGPTRLTDDMLVDIVVDSDNTATTGDPDTGGEYAIELFGGEANLFKWDGTNFSRRTNDPPQSTLTFSQLAISINASELGNTTRFNFAITVITGVTVVNGDLDFSSARADFAPDLGHGLWNYKVNTAPLKLVAKGFKLTPSRPVAGRTFTAALTVARNDTGAVLKGGTVVCTATVGGARITARVRKFVGTQARCAWSVPGSARGRPFRGSIAVVFEGRRISRSISATVG
jgi:hypothetical protein